MSIELLENTIFAFSYIVVWKKGYQQFQEPRGTSVIKVKGVARVTGKDTAFYISKVFGIEARYWMIKILIGDETKYVWDTPEYELPPLVC